MQCFVPPTGSRAPGRPARRIALLAAVFLLAGCGDDQAPITVSPAEFDFGRVMQGETREHTFTLTNHSHRAVAFTTQPNCGCFAVTRNLKPLDPGQSLDFSVMFQTANRQGRIRGKWVTIHTNHPDVPEIVLPLTGDVFRAFSVTPVLFNLGQINGSDANYEPRKVLIKPVDGCKLRFLGSFAMPQVFDTTAEAGAGGALEVTLRLRKDALRHKGPFLAQVRLDLEVTLPSGEARRQQPVVHLRGFWSL